MVARTTGNESADVPVPWWPKDMVRLVRRVVGLVTSTAAQPWSAPQLAGSAGRPTGAAASLCCRVRPPSITTALALPELASWGTKPLPTGRVMGVAWKAVVIPAAVESDVPMSLTYSVGAVIARE